MRSLNLQSPIYTWNNIKGNHNYFKINVISVVPSSKRPVKKKNLINKNTNLPM